MLAYGIDNVRGGSYCQVNLAPNTVSHLERELHGVEDRCFECGSRDHYLVDCPNKPAAAAGDAASSKKRAHDGMPC